MPPKNTTEKKVRQRKAPKKIQDPIVEVKPTKKVVKQEIEEKKENNEIEKEQLKTFSDEEIESLMNTLNTVNEIFGDEKEKTLNEQNKFFKNVLMWVKVMIMEEFYNTKRDVALIKDLLEEYTLIPKDKTSKKLNPLELEEQLKPKYENL